MPEPVTKTEGETEASRKGAASGADGVTRARSARLRGAMTPRVFLLSLVLIPLNAWWLVEIEYIRYSDNATTQALFFNSIGILLILLLINALLRKIAPRRVFTSQELAALYIIVTIGSNLAGHDQLQILFTTLSYIARHGGENGWDTKLVPYLPRTLFPHNKDAVADLFIGNTTLYRWDHIQPWLAPLGWWTLFVMILVWTMLCLTALFRRQWDAERLTYPIAEIPVQIIAQPHTLFRSKLFWGGAVIGASGQIVNMIHSLYPSVPTANIGVQYYQATDYPWTAVGSLPICTYPFAYGLSFLLPTQLGFSCWFFFLMSRVQLLLAAMSGYDESGKFPYVQQQGVGACLGLFIAIVWAELGQLRHVWKIAIGKDKNLAREDADEPLSYRMTVFGLIGGVAGLLLFATIAGMRWQAAALFLGILFVIVIVVARLRAELGLPTYELYQVGAEHVMQRVSGTSAYTRNDLGVMSLFFWLTRTHRQFPMQNQVDAMRLGRRTETRLRSVSSIILYASALGTVAAFWALLHSTYQIGYDSAKFSSPAVGSFGREPWNKMDSWVSSPTPSDIGSIWAYLFGIGFTLFLSAMRSRFLWWPFHPAGYLVSGSFGLFRLWLPIFVSWLFKALILRYGGLRAYRQAVPFFLGLVLGEFSAGFIRTLLDVSLGLHLPPNSGIGGL